MYFAALIGKPPAMPEDEQAREKIFRTVLYSISDEILDRNFVATHLIWSGAAPSGQRERLKDNSNFLAWAHDMLQEIVSASVSLRFVCKFFQDKICKAAKQRCKHVDARRSTGRVFHHKIRKPKDANNTEADANGEKEKEKAVEEKAVEQPANTSDDSLSAQATGDHGDEEQSYDQDESFEANFEQFIVKEEEAEPESGTENHNFVILKRPQCPYVVYNADDEAILDSDTDDEEKAKKIKRSKRAKNGVGKRRKTGTT